MPAVAIAAIVRIVLSLISCFTSLAPPPSYGVSRRSWPDDASIGEKAMKRPPTGGGLSERRIDPFRIVVEECGDQTGLFQA
jgi:hypothetical protein